MKVIGFTNKYYTLWEVTEETRPLGNGRSYIITHFNYIKNISFDKNTALSKYPNVQIDENLRGKTQSWETKKEVWNNVDTFRFGKFCYEKIDSKADDNYLAWYWGQIYGDHKDYVSEVLKSRGYEIRTWGNDEQYLMSPTALENEKIRNEKMSKMISKLDNNEQLEISVTSNPDEDGIILWDDNIYVKFPEVKENYYNGYFYYLPVLNGKAKRVKNKNVVTDDYTYEIDNNGLTIIMKNFKIVK